MISIGNVFGAICLLIANFTVLGCANLSGRENQYSNAQIQSTENENLDYESHSQEKGITLLPNKNQYSADKIVMTAGGLEEEFHDIYDREAVRRVIHSRIKWIKSCYSKRTANSTPIGKVLIRFVIETQGRVKKASVVSSTLNEPTVEFCMASQIQGVLFPAPLDEHSPAIVDYPFTFEIPK